jgi:cytochrome o ubiquinol oxidase subunit II
VIIPVYIFTFIFSWKYRASNPNAKYDPHLIDNTLAECIWWGIPLILTVIIGALTWVETYRLDPFKPLISDKKTMTIQVVALQWKWLFIYPGDQPIRFEITADAPMNSFWIPDLGGQIYAMPKMKTELNLIANQVGDFRGSSANISGEGFAGMHFIARASTEEDYKNWVQAARNSSKALTFEEYNKIAAPSKNDLPATYVLKDDHLFHQILMKFMQPQQKPQLKQPMGNE